MVNTRAYIKRAEKTRDGSLALLNDNKNAAPTGNKPGEDLGKCSCSTNNWNRILNHGVDQIELTQATWNPKLTHCGCGDIDLGGPETGTLTRPIHPLYQTGNWILEDFPHNGEVWRLVEPALRLASEVLETEAAMTFFRRIMYSTSRTISRRTYLEYDTPTDTSDQNATVREALVNMAKHFKILFAAIDLKDGSPTQTHAITLVSQKWFGEKVFIRGNVDKLPDDDYMTHYLAINQAYADYASGPRPSASAKSSLEARDSDRGDRGDAEVAGDVSEAR